MFECQVGNHKSEKGDKLTLITTEWRKKEYPAVELPKLLGDPRRRFSRGGTGYEAAVTKRACSACAPDAIAKAPSPPATGTDFTVGDLVDKPLSTAQEIPTALSFGKMGSRFSVRLPATCFYPKGKVTRLVDRISEPAREAYLLIEDVRKKSEDSKCVEVSFKIVKKPLPEEIAA